MGKKQQIIYPSKKQAEDIAIQTICSNAYSYFNMMIKNRNFAQNNKMPAIVFDIDDTLLCTKKMDSSNKYYLPNIPVCTLYNRVQQLGYRTLIITGRYAINRVITENNLRAVGVYNWDTLIMREEHMTNTPANEYKESYRKKLSNQYLIVGNIGDQESDLIGAHSGYKIKLPYPGYIIR